MIHFLGEIILRVSEAGHTGLTGDRYYDDLGVQYAYLLRGLKITDPPHEVFIGVVLAIAVLSTSALFLDLWRVSRV
jgi:hypothetical protein